MAILIEVNESMVDPYVSGAKFGIDTAKGISSWFTRSKGQKKALVGELKTNRSYLEMVVNDNVPLEKVTDKLSTDRYISLRDSGFNFKSLKSGKIANYPEIEGTNLASWRGKDIGKLIESIYDGIIEIKIRHPVVGDHPNYRWMIRVNNLLKKISLLIRHVNS